jgi:hypothetical protein
MSEDGFTGWSYKRVIAASKKTLENPILGLTDKYKQEK